MAPVIRISDVIYKRLEAYARGFDAPNNVIERLIDFYETHQKDSKKSISTSTLTKSSIEAATSFNRNIRKPRDPKKEKELKKAVGKRLNWGDFKLISNSILDFHNSPTKVLCKYSSYSAEQNRWFWGVSQKYWSEWNDDFYLALLMENENQDGYSFLLLEPKEASYLFTRCSESNGEKKINLRFYKSDGRLLLQEWQEHDVMKKIKEV
ncbi:hypothetical protein BMS3Abin14_00677 [bacterium BMS3Abin14]|nr:hypothetical protein BMS3Abin14_00677 [bacterium BMS3Abin14]HDZ62146.1 hypothetical protein [Nitrospirota bacterium]